ncbi:hypothetical protein CKAH01_06468 [Colletotrichum kahawae]|uniref:2EXR domain-containing protein n=1 Tax=Colletotrichum kahawae TaxID=34407 RepID=A0AAD9Y7W8_COLKA|nr:hypothetical protein CKAH01_06468 [Colletotrichum kahawae]
MEASFPQFSRLPNELRLLVWEAAFDQSPPQAVEGQLTRIDLHLMFLVFPRAQQQAINPAMLSVCRTSRQVLLKLGGYRVVKLPVEPSEKKSTPIWRPVWFDFAHDIVMLPRLKTNSYGINIKWSRIENKNVLHKIQRLAVPWSALHAGRRRPLTQLERDARWRLLLRDLHELFPNLTDIYLFVPTVRQQPLYDYSTDQHPHEPARCKSLRPVLEPILEPLDSVKLPDCDCLEKPSTLGDAIFDIKYALDPLVDDEIEWEEWAAAIEVHGRWLVREGLDMGLLRGVPGIEIESAFCKGSSGTD